MLFMEYYDKEKFLHNIQEYKVKDLTTTPFVAYECEELIKSKK